VQVKLRGAKLHQKFAKGKHPQPACPSTLG